MNDKQKIIDLFHANVKGKRANIEGKNIKHDGKEGHWLEQQFGIKANADNQPDLFGYELKNETTSKTTFGDWSANIYIFTSDEYKHLFKGDKKYKKQDSFLMIFGKPNEKKDGRYSWSGEPCPKIGNYNSFGQKLEITKNKDIVVIYSYEHDKRVDKNIIVPKELHVGLIELARWYGVKSPSTSRADKCLKDKLEDKFNDKGWFTCKKDKAGVYQKICFGKPINYDEWIKLVEQGIVFFDSGMYQGNKRPYSEWRANNNLWDSLIIEEYE